MTSEKRGGWYNYRTGTHDYMTGVPDNLEDYIPQSPAAQSLYKIHLSLGLEPAEAAIKVLDAAIGNRRSNDGGPMRSKADDGR